MREQIYSPNYAKITIDQQKGVEVPFLQTDSQSS